MLLIAILLFEYQIGILKKRERERELNLYSDTHLQLLTGTDLEGAPEGLDPPLIQGLNIRFKRKFFYLTRLFFQTFCFSPYNLHIPKIR